VAEIRLAAQLRTEFGKGAARRIRRASKIPAVIYGHGSDPQHVSLPSHQTQLALRDHNALLSVEVDGGSAPQLALPKQVQRDPIKGTIEHVDLVIVRRGEKVTVDVDVYTEGESAPGTVVVLDHSQVPVEAPATHIPADITVSVEGLENGEQVLAGDLKLPGDATVTLDPEAMILSVTHTRASAEEEAEAEEEEAETGETGEEAAGESGEAESEAS
jgi:large subunit ribosomal protein L25